MSTLIVTILFGIAFAFFATQNISSVTIHLGSYSIFSIPLYMVALGSLLLGIFISWIISLIDGVTMAFKLRRRESQISESSREVEALKNRLTNLELENTKLRHTKDPENRRNFEIHPEHKSIADKIRSLAP